MKIYSNKSLLTILGLIFLIGNISKASSIAVPHDAIIIQQANLIITGQIDVSTGETLIIVDKVLKGNIALKKRLKLVLDTPPMGFSLVTYLKDFQGKRVILLGQYNKDEKILHLPWYISTIWPYGHNGGFFPSDTYEECEAFILAMLNYQVIGKKDKNELIEKLLDDVQIPDRRCAVLCFSDKMLSSALDDETMERQYRAVLMAEIATAYNTDPNTSSNSCIVNNIAYLSPMMPPSICATYLVNVAKQKNNKSSQLALSSAKSILRSRRMIKKGEVKSPTQMEAVLKEKLGPLEISDAKNAMKIYDSKNKRLQKLAGKVIGLALKDKTKPDSTKGQKAFWQNKIRQKALKQKH